MFASGGRVLFTAIGLVAIGCRAPEIRAARPQESTSIAPRGPWTGSCSVSACDDYVNELDRGLRNGADDSGASIRSVIDDEQWCEQRAQCSVHCGACHRRRGPGFTRHRVSREVFVDMDSR